MPKLYFKVTYSGTLYCNITLQRTSSKICLYFGGYILLGEFSITDATNMQINPILLFFQMGL